MHVGASRLCRGHWAVAACASPDCFMGASWAVPRFKIWRRGVAWHGASPFRPAGWVGQNRKLTDCGLPCRVASVATRGFKSLALSSTVGVVEMSGSAEDPRRK